MSLSPDVLRQCWFVAGPTAVGKTASSLLLAERLGAEIISMDSMAIYRGMDVGTAKPTAAERTAIPHHLVDVIDPQQEYSVAEYLSASAQAVDEILQRQHVPLFVGGTGLYLRSLLRGVFNGPPADWGLRQELERQQAERGSAWLHQQLADVDPPAAARLHPHDVRRVIRAIEVYRQTGQRLSDLQAEAARPSSERPACAVWLEPPRDWLYDRIDRRVDLMMQQGLMEEVSWLHALDPPASQTARQALGYRELLDHLDGRCDQETAVAQIKTGTRQFAKRQHTWFRGLEECQQIAITGTQTAEEIAEAVVTSTRL